MLFKITKIVRYSLTTISFCCLISEITHRFQTAKPAIKQTLLQYLLPWLHNVELVDPNLQQGHSPLNYLNKPLDDHPDYIAAPLRGDGWGSPQATEMVLNNLLYITAKVGRCLEWSYCIGHHCVFKTLFLGKVQSNTNQQTMKLQIITNLA